MTAENQENLQEWIKKPEHFLILSGNAGTGKTYTAISIIKYLCSTKTEFFPYKLTKGEFEFIMCREVFDHLKSLYSMNSSDSSAKERLAKVRLLVIDDLGATRNNEWQQEVLLAFIDERYQNLRPTIFTTNLSREGIKEVFDQRIASRLLASENLFIEEYRDDLREEGK